MMNIETKKHISIITVQIVYENNSIVLVVDASTESPIFSFIYLHVF